MLGIRWASRATLTERRLSALLDRHDGAGRSTPSESPAPAWSQKCHTLKPSCREKLDVGGRRHFGRQRWCARDLRAGERLTDQSARSYRRCEAWTKQLKTLRLLLQVLLHPDLRQVLFLSRSERKDVCPLVEPLRSALSGLRIVGYMPASPRSTPRSGVITACDEAPENC